MAGERRKYPREYKEAAVAMAEQENKNRTLDKNAAENLNIVRKWVLFLLKIADVGMKLSLRKKRFLIGCDSTQYLQKVIEL
jgi:hypothetical protein